MKQLLSCLVLTSAMYAQVSMPAVVVNSSGQSVHGLQKSDFSVDCGTGATVDAVEEVTPVALNNFADPTPVFILYDAPSIVLPIQGKVAKLDRADDPALDRLESGKKSLGGATADSANGVQEKVDQAKTRLQSLLRPVYPRTGGKLSGEIGLVPSLGSTDDRPDSLQLVAKMLQRSRQRKLLIWLTGEVPTSESSIVVDPVTKSYRPCRGEGECSELHSTKPRSSRTSWINAIEALNESRISVYPIHLSVYAPNVSECC